MKDLIQTILIYIVIVSVLRGLISNPRYAQYFQFFSGMVMILLMLSPFLSFLQIEDTWYDLLEKNILKMDLGEIQEEIKLADNTLQDMIEQEYIETVKEQVTAMAEEKGVGLKDITVKLEKEDNEYTIAEITGTTGGGEEENEERISIETIQVEGKDSGYQGTESEEDTSQEAKTLREQICSYFVLGEDKVHLWK